jgi:hypothetical protein
MHAAQGALLRAVGKVFTNCNAHTARAAAALIISPRVRAHSRQVPEGDPSGHHGLSALRGQA